MQTRGDGVEPQEWVNIYKHIGDRLSKKVVRVAGELHDHTGAFLKQMREQVMPPSLPGHAASRISSRSSGHTTMVLKRLTWGTVREAADSRGCPLHGRSASCAAHLPATRHLPLIGVALSRVARLVARRLRVRPSKRGGSSQQQKQWVSPPVPPPPHTHTQMLLRRSVELTFGARRG